MDEPSATNAQAPLPKTRRFGVPACWILYGLSAVPIIALIVFTVWLMAASDNPGFPGGIIIGGIAMYLLLPAWGLTVASLVTALVRMSKIRRYNRENGTLAPGELSAALCAAFSAIAIAAPFLLTVLLQVLATGQTALYSALLY